jgi:hypothetical protein
MSTSVVIEDLGVHLPCKGSSAIVDADSASRSKNLKERKQWIRIEPIPEVKPMPVWPFLKVQPKPSPPVPPPPDDDIRQILSVLAQRTQTLLEIMAAKSSPQDSSEILAAIARIPSISVAAAIHTQVQSDVPLFIPGQIVPTQAQADSRIHAREEAVTVDDMDASLQALRQARKKK